VNSYLAPGPKAIRLLRLSRDQIVSQGQSLNLEISFLTPRGRKRNSDKAGKGTGTKQRRKRKSAAVEQETPTPNSKGRGGDVRYSDDDDEGENDYMFEDDDIEISPSKPSAGSTSDDWDLVVGGDDHKNKEVARRRTKRSKIDFDLESD
jgi:hypothetical protein